MSDLRLQQLHSWFCQLDSDFKNWRLTPLFADASFRRYFRTHSNDGRTFVLLDSPPQSEPLQPFVEIAKSWRAKNIYVPEIHAHTLDIGFALLEDVGNDHLECVEITKKHDQYTLAIELLRNIQTVSDKLPAFDATYMQSELALFCDWTLVWVDAKLTAIEKLALMDLFNWLCQQLGNQPRCVIHRDFHCRNLMMVDNSIAVLDFQDAMIGPYTYDIASLLGDAYVTHSKKFCQQMQSIFIDNCSSAKNRKQFPIDYIATMLQRHIKVVGIFCRLWLRDGKAQYLQSIPRICGYIDESSRILMDYNPQLRSGLEVVVSACRSTVAKITDSNEL